MKTNKQRLSSITGVPLFQFLRDANTVAKENNTTPIYIADHYSKNYKKPGGIKFTVVKQFATRRELVDAVAFRVVRDNPMQIDKFNMLYDKLVRRYRSRVCLGDCFAGSLCVKKTEDGWFNAIHIFRKNGELLNTRMERDKARNKIRKKASPAEIESKVMIAELLFIQKTSQYEELTWNAT